MTQIIDVIGEIVALPPAQIDPDHDGRVGQYFPLKAEGLASRISTDGQNEPIWVSKNGPRAKLPFKLVAGLHRLEACRMLGRAIEARIVSGTAAELKARQASENLDRRVMTVLERSMFVAAVADAAKARLLELHGGMTQQAVARIGRPVILQADEDATEGMDNLSMRYSWKAETAEAVGLGEKDVQRAMRIFRCLVEPNRAAIDAIKQHPVADNGSSLLLLAGKSQATQGRALAWLAENPEAKTAEQALVAIEAAGSKGQSDIAAKGPVDRVFANLNRWSSNDWTSAAPQFAAAVPDKALDALCDALIAERSARKGGAK